MPPEMDKLEFKQSQENWLCWVRGILVDGRIDGARKKQEAEKMSERDEWVRKFQQASSEINDWRGRHPRARNL
jgi:hypothetical protein